MGVQFNEESYTMRTPARASKGIPGWLISHGIAKSESQASVILVAVCIVCWAGIYLLMFSGGESGRVPNLDAPDATEIDPSTNLPYPTQ